MHKPNTELEKEHAAKIHGNMVKKFFSLLGPGLTTGAADDDPSGVATYASAGSLFGTSLLWTAPLTWPLMASVQFMCARIGMVTGKGLSWAFCEKFPKWLILIAACALFVANTINVGADLAGMADAAGMLTGFSSLFYVILFGIIITLATIWFRYFHIAAILKWLALVLFAYIITAFLVAPDWGPILRDTFIPKLPKSHEAWSMLVAILGTTISPYLFYWQAAMEVEEEKAIGRELSTIISPFFLPTRKMGEILGVGHSRVARWLRALEVLQIIHLAPGEVRKPGLKRSPRYLYGPRVQEAESLPVGAISQAQLPALPDRQSGEAA
jgi:Mn2+/Fe2+ NRAMP family transporter